MTKKEKKDDIDIFRMKDLIEKTGINRETIHFYLTEGLLPQPKKTSKNMAWYSQEHIDRLNLIKQLQEKQFLPLKAIKSILNNSMHYGFTPEQQNLIRELKTKVVDTSKSINININELVEKNYISREEVDKLINIGFIHPDTENNTLTLEDYSLVESWIKLKELDTKNILQFRPSDLEIFIDITEIILSQELNLIKDKPPALTYVETKVLIEKAIPLVNNIISTLHNKKIREFITKFE